MSAGLRVGRGPRPPADTVVDRLAACHARIRGHLDLARRLAGPAPAAAQEVVEAAEAVRRYFDEALPLHVADEDQSIAPRLRGAPGAPAELLAELASLETDHGAHEPARAALVALAARLVVHPEARAALAPALARAAAELAAELLPHLEREETRIFPAVARWDASVQASVLAELAARR